MKRSTNLRDYEHSPSSGTDARQAIGGSLASKTPAQSAKNVTKQSTVATPSSPGPGGGKNTGK